MIVQHTRWAMYSCSVIVDQWRPDGIILISHPKFVTYTGLKLFLTSLLLLFYDLVQEDIINNNEKNVSGISVMHRMPNKSRGWVCSVGPAS